MIQLLRGLQTEEQEYHIVSIYDNHYDYLILMWIQMLLLLT